MKIFWIGKYYTMYYPGTDSVGNCWDHMRTFKRSYSKKCSKNTSIKKSNAEPIQSSRIGF